MAGSYPDSPSERMAYDEDSSVQVFTLSWVLQPEATPAQKQELNDEDHVVAYNCSAIGSTYLATLFPELREVDGHFISTNGYQFQNLSTSGDTTNGIDGSWVVQVGSPTTWLSTIPEWRNNITSLAVSNVRGIRINLTGNASWFTQHIYGEIAPGQTPDRLLFIDGTSGLEYSLPIDFGDVPRGSAQDTTWKLRNNSASFTASTVQVTAESLYLASGNWYTFSEGGAFQSTLPLASGIGPGADSPTLTLRRIIPDTETVGLHAARIQASVGSWA